jgi:hypothetical protein
VRIAPTDSGNINMSEPDKNDPLNRDITDRKRAEVELEERIKILEKRLSQSEFNAR